MEYRVYRYQHTQQQQHRVEFSMPETTEGFRGKIYYLQLCIMCSMVTLWHTYLVLEKVPTHTHTQIYGSEVFRTIRISNTVYKDNIFCYSEVPPPDISEPYPPLTINNVFCTFVVNRIHSLKLIILGGFGGGVHDSCLSSVSSCLFGDSCSPDFTESLSDPTMNLDRSKTPLKQTVHKILQLS